MFKFTNTWKISSVVEITLCSSRAFSARYLTPYPLSLLENLFSAWLIPHSKAQLGLCQSENKYNTRLAPAYHTQPAFLWHSAEATVNNYIVKPLEGNLQKNILSDSFTLFLTHSYTLSLTLPLFHSFTFLPFFSLLQSFFFTPVLFYSFTLYRLSLSFSHFFIPSLSLILLTL